MNTSKFLQFELDLRCQVFGDHVCVGHFAKMFEADRREIRHPEENIRKRSYQPVLKIEQSLCSFRLHHTIGFQTFPADSMRSLAWINEIAFKNNPILHEN